MTRALYVPILLIVIQALNRLISSRNVGIDMKIALFAFTASLLLSACTTQHKINVEEMKFSGYLTHYEKLKPLADNTAMRWLDSDLKRYRKIYIEPINLLPGFNVSEQVSTAEATKMAQYLNQGFNDRLSKIGRLATAPGDNVLTIRPAITAITSETEELSAYQYVLPVAIARTMIKSATDRRDAIAAIYLEAQLFDGKTNYLKGEVLRKGISEQSDNKEVTQEDVKALLDSWLDFFEQQLNEIYG